MSGPWWPMLVAAVGSLAWPGVSGHGAGRADPGGGGTHPGRGGPRSTVDRWGRARGPAADPRGGLPATGGTGALLVRARLLRPPRWRPPGAGRGSPDASQLADALVLVALALRSGLALVDALDEVVRDSTGQVREDLAAVVAALRWGRTARQAWQFASPAWEPVAKVWQVAEATGGAPADVLAAAAEQVREAHERDLERRAARAGVLLVLPLGLAFLPAFGLTALVPVVIALARSLRLG
jgi:hypothetical protein